MTALDSDQALDNPQAGALSRVARLNERLDAQEKVLEQLAERVQTLEHWVIKS